MSNSKRHADDTWMEVAQTMSSLEAEMIAGLLRTADIPSYIEGNALGLPSTFWGMNSPSRVYVPEKFYGEALALLDEDDSDLPAIDEPYIQL